MWYSSLGVYVLYEFLLVLAPRVDGWTFRLLVWRLSAPHRKVCSTEGGP